MSVCLLVIHDGRHDYLERTIESANDHLPMDVFDQVVTVDDTDHKLGFAGAVQHGWEQVETEWVFHLEGDFTFNENIPIHRMIRLLQDRPYLAQVALKRQPWNPQEHRAGGIVELHPGDFHEVTDGEVVWTEHRRFFTTNPSVYSSRLCRGGWPQEPHSEGMFTHRLLTDPLLRFAFWGGKFDAPKVEHIGHERAGTGY